MILLCGECKQWQAEARRRIGHGRRGYCPVNDARTSRVHICNVLKDESAVAKNRAQIQHKHKPHQRPDPQFGRVYEAAALQRLGFSTPEIAQKMGIHQTTVCKYIRKYRLMQKEAQHDDRASNFEV